MARSHANQTIFWIGLLLLAALSVVLVAQRSAEAETAQTCFARVESSGIVYSSIAEAANATANTDTVKVAGQCAENVWLGEAHSGVQYLGGYSSTDWNNRDIVANKTTVGADAQRYGFFLQEAERVTISGFWITGVAYGIEVDSKDVVIENNYIHELEPAAGETRGAGISIYSSQFSYTHNIIVRNNTVWFINSGTNHGIEVGRLNPDRNLGNIKILNNTIVWTTDDGIHVGEPSTTGEVTDLEILNNVIVSTNRAAVAVWNGIEAEVDHNCRWNTDVNTVGPNDVRADPMFVDVDGHDWRLQAGSPCVDKGVATFDVSADTTGTARPQAGFYDMGAHEVVDSTTACIPTTTPLQELVMPSADVTTLFGSSMSANENIAAIGAIETNEPGAVRVYHKIGSGWTDGHTLRPSDSANGDRFGFSVAVGSNRIAVGADHYYHANDTGGMVYIFDYDPATDTWTQSADFQPVEVMNDSRFGLRVALEGDTLVVSRGNTGEETVYIYELSGGVWFQAARLTPPATNSSGLSAFGNAIAIENNRVSIGDYLTSSVYVYAKSGEAWVLSETIAPGPADFGYAIAADGNRLAVNRYNEGTYIYEHNGSSFQQSAAFTTPIVLSGPTDGITIDGDRFVVGTTFENTLFRYELNNGTWGLVETLQKTTGEFGRTLAQHGTTLFVGETVSEGKAWIYSVPTCQPLLSVTLFAGDNAQDDPGNLTPSYQEMIDGIVSATAADPNKTAVVLADLDQNHDTQAMIVQNGSLTPLVGLPDTFGVLQPTLNEYDMTDGSQLGGFLKWALATHGGANVKTTVSYIGHGTFVAPAVAQSTYDGFPTQRNSADPIFPLPARGSFTDGFTDMHPNRSLITPYAIQQMLQIGTDHGAQSVDVLDLTHCFAASVEELYEVTNGANASYVDMVIGSPSYAYFTPDMVGAALSAVSPADSAQAMATAMMTAYDQSISAVDNTDGNPDVEHPRALHVYDSARLPAIKTNMDTLAVETIARFDTNPNDAAQLLSQAYQNLSGLSSNLYYDTTFCESDWALSQSDAMIDMNNFMFEYATKFGSTSPVGVAALAVQSSVQDAIVASAVHNGTPWYGSVGAAEWDFSSSTMSLYADLEGVVNGSERSLAWQSRYYTHTVLTEQFDQFDFVVPTTTAKTWADVLTRYWQVRSADEGLTVTTNACLPTFPELTESAELSAVRLTAPITGTLRVGQGTRLAGLIQTDRAVVNPAVTFSVVDATTEQTVFTETVGAGYLVTGTHEIEASQLFTPTQQRAYTILMNVDLENRFEEANESNNGTGRAFPANSTPNVTLTATVDQDQQFISTGAVTLNLSSNRTLDFLVVKMFQFSDETGVQEPYVLNEIVIENPGTTPSFELPATLKAGRVRFHLWGMYQTYLSEPHAVVEFNYAPIATITDAFDSDDYTFTAQDDEYVDLLCDVQAGSAIMLVWEANNYWSPQQITCNGVVQLSPATAGEYLIRVIAQSADTRYQVLHTSLPPAARTAHLAERINLPRPDVILPSAELNMTNQMSVLECNDEQLVGYIPLSVQQSCSGIKLYLPMLARP